MRIQHANGQLAVMLGLLCCFTFGELANAQDAELKSVLKSDTDDLRALIDLEPADIPVQRSTTKPNISTPTVQPAAAAITPTDTQIRPAQFIQQPKATKPAIKNSAVEQIATPVPQPSATNAAVSSAAKPNAAKPSSPTSVLTPVRKPSVQPVPESAVRSSVLRRQSSPTPTSNSPTAAPSSTLSVDDATFALGILAADDLKNNAPIVRGVIVDSPAAKAGIMSGDRIRSIGPQRITNTENLRTAITGANGSVMYLNVQRGLQQRIFRIDMPAASLAAANQGVTSVKAIPQPTMVRRPVAQSVNAGRAPQPNMLRLSPTAGKQVRSAATQSSTRGPNAEIPPPRPEPVAGNSPANGRVAVPGSQNQQIIRGQTPIPRRPRIGDGGRLIGNGRVINTLRSIVR